MKMKKNRFQHSCNQLTQAIDTVAKSQTGDAPGHTSTVFRHHSLAVLYVTVREVAESNTRTVPVLAAASKKPLLTL